MPLFLAGQPLTQPNRRRAVIPAAVAAGFDPLTISGAFAMFDSATPALSDGASVTTWADTSGNSRTATPAATAPIYKLNILNGYPVVRFPASSSDQDMTTTSFAVSQPMTIFCVVSFLAGTGQSFVYDGVSSRVALFRENPSTWNFYAGSVIAGGSTDLSWHITALSVNGASSKLRIDGGAGTSGNPGSNGISGGVVLGNQPGFVTPLNGDMAFWVGYNSDLSLTDLNYLGNGFASKYGLSWTTAT